MLMYKAQGIHKIYIMFDGDAAGILAAKDLKPLLEECEFITEILNLPEGLDPGMLDQEYIDSIREYIQ